MVVEVAGGAMAVAAAGLDHHEIDRV